VAAHLFFGTRCQLRQMLRSTVSNKNLSFRILAMFGEFDEPVMLSSNVGADDIIRKALKTSTIQPSGAHLYIRGIR
jgi:hypothetical protein